MWPAWTRVERREVAESCEQQRWPRPRRRPPPRTPRTPTFVQKAAEPPNAANAPASAANANTAGAAPALRDPVNVCGAALGVECRPPTAAPR